MASLCGSCNKSILNAEFVSCSGVCNNLFHIKCVGVHKSMLSTINNCSNIHWYCHECNADNRSFSSAIDRINDAIGLLSNSLSGDLLKFFDSFKTLMETFVESFNTALITQIVPNLITRSQNVSSPEPTEQLPIEPHVGKPSYEANFASQNFQEPNKSVVVSNIGTDVTMECLTDYVVDKLKVAKDSVKLALLLPAGKKKEDLNFLQYKITIPEVNHGSIMCPDLWPSNVLIRDFVWKRKSLGVTKQQFLV